MNEDVTKMYHHVMTSGEVKKNCLSQFYWFRQFFTCR